MARGIVYGSSGFLSAGDNIIAFWDVQTYTSSTSFTKKREIQINMGGFVRVSFTLRQTGGYTGSAQIYKNGVAVGTLRTRTVNSNLEFTEDFAVNVGDKIALYMKSSSSSGEAINDSMAIKANQIPQTTRIL